MDTSTKRKYGDTSPKRKDKGLLERSVSFKFTPDFLQKLHRKSLTFTSVEGNIINKIEKLYVSKVENLDSTESSIDDLGNIIVKVPIKNIDNL